MHRRSPVLITKAPFLAPRRDTEVTRLKSQSAGQAGPRSDWATLAAAEGLIIVDDGYILGILSYIVGSSILYSCL